MHLYLVRHGETEENLRHEVQGQRHGTLSRTGSQQVQALADRFRNIQLQAILTSDLNRAMQTADGIAQYHDLALVPLLLLREQHYGIYQGKIMHELSPAASGGKEPVVSPPDGESVDDLHARTCQFCSYLTERFDGQTLVAVSHGVFLSILLWAIQDKPLPDRPTIDLDNASVSLVTGSKRSECRVQFFNDTTHLNA